MGRILFRCDDFALTTHVHSFKISTVIYSSRLQEYRVYVYVTDYQVLKAEGDEVLSNSLVYVLSH